MVLDDLLADRESQARPIGLAESGESLEEAVQDLRRDALAAVFQLSDNFLMMPPPDMASAAFPIRL